jgi:DNA-binding NarL/FixJ family response regulator
MKIEFADVTLLIADRQPLFRYGVCRLLKEHRSDWHCAEADSFDSVLAHLRGDPVGLLLYDTELVGQELGADLRQLRGEIPEQLILAMADNGNWSTIFECLAAGANGYVLKSATLAQLLRAVETVLSGAVFAPAALSGASQAPRTRGPRISPVVAKLTGRQIEVLQLLSDGCATKTIARRLGLGIGTVKVHLAAIYRALEAHNRVEALVKARDAVLSRPAHLGELVAA